MSRGLCVALCLLAAMAAAACSDAQSQTHAYGTLEQAQAAGAVDRGWLPEGLPPGTREIRLGYIPGGIVRWGLFNFPPGERAHLEARLTQEEVDLDGLRPGVPARIEWWPVALRGTLDGERLALTGLRAYRWRAGGLIVAVNWSQGRAYYWPDHAGR